MANSVMMFDTLGYRAGPSGRGDRLGLGPQAAGGASRTAPIASPACRRSGTPALAAHARGRGRARRRRACAALRLVARRGRSLDVVGDWAVRRPGRAAGRLGVPVPTTPIIRTWTTPRSSACCCTGTAIPAHAAVDRARARVDHRHAVAATAAGARSTPDNTYYYLNHIPFADHGALLDPPTADVTARCVSFLAQLGMPEDDPAIGARARLSAARTGDGRQLVRPLGHQLHLRHLVGALRPQRGRRAAR